MSAQRSTPQTKNITQKPAEDPCETLRARSLKCSITHLNERINCKQFFEDYKLCRKLELEKIVQERKREKRSIF